MGNSQINAEQILLRITDPAYNAACVLRDRNRIARKLREARVRVKENKKRNGGLYILPEEKPMLRQQLQARMKARQREADRRHRENVK